MRWMLPTIALVTAACAGGQTGEITELGACREPAGAVSLEESSEAGPPATEQLANLTTSGRAPLTWADGGRPSTAVEVSFEPTGEPATLVGGEGCEQPHLHTPVSVTLRTDDGAFDEVLDAAIALRGLDSAPVRGSLTLASLRGSFDAPDMDPTRAELIVELGSEPGALGGQLLLRSGEPDEDELRVAAF